MSDMKCPFCQQELSETIWEYGEHETTCYNCDITGNSKLWQELIRTRKALDYAIDVIKTVAKMSDKMSMKYGETLVEQLDNIQAYCWQEGYVLTHEEDLERVITALEQKDAK